MLSQWAEFPHWEWYLFYIFTSLLFNARLVCLSIHVFVKLTPCARPMLAPRTTVEQRELVLPFLKLKVKYLEFIFLPYFYGILIYFKLLIYLKDIMFQVDEQLSHFKFDAWEVKYDTRAHLLQGFKLQMSVEKNKLDNTVCHCVCWWRDVQCS